ncbi:Lrp/AsnC family transcriptional regulator [Stappia sp. F7233]|uniref:Lrp/AsnC family transcriptional regulator n=1 Tax=Stappia albiluteola TaxID=2758565 RepID=A0A839AJ55_9HYPH|nr:Lrp/AsnC family transcriptional regulator [Stappia albiluteola]MBA5778797.1 Lrp/AsnC family transcriptional regulator [Stappia albiluteola]
MKAPDQIDRQILALLKQDGRMPLKTIAGRVGLARSSVQERIARLEASGVIRRYTIEEDGQAAGRVAAYLWIRTESAICERVAPKLLELPEILACRSIAGELDMVAHVEAEDPQRIAEIRAMVACLEGVTSVETHLVLRDWPKTR